MVKTESSQDIFVYAYIYVPSRIYINSFRSTESYTNFDYLKYLDWFFKVTIPKMKLAIIYPGFKKTSLIFNFWMIKNFLYHLIYSRTSDNNSFNFKSIVPKKQNLTL